MKTTRPYVVAGPAEAIARLGPWLEARRARQPVIVLPGLAAEVVADPSRHVPADTEAVLVIGPRRRSPATFLPGLFLRVGSGQLVPVGWLPDGGERLETFAKAAARVLARETEQTFVAPGNGAISSTAKPAPCHVSHDPFPGVSRCVSRDSGARELIDRPKSSAGVLLEFPELPPAPWTFASRAGPDAEHLTTGPESDRRAEMCARNAGPLPGPVVVLGQWHDRFLRVSARTVRWFEKQGGVSGVFRWTSERIVGADLVQALQHGPGVAFYYGHGRSRGLAGYHGLRSKHLPARWREPIAAMLAVCCDAASRRRIGLSFTEDLVLRGVVAGALAATRRTLHDHNRQLGPAFCEAIVPGNARTLAEVVMRAPVKKGILPGPYRFIGDAAIPLLGASDAAARCAEVFAPAADSELPEFPVAEIELPVEVLAG